MNPSSDFRFELDLLQREIAKASLLPTVYERYRPLLADGLPFFPSLAGGGQPHFQFIEPNLALVSLLK
jgi:hypothetical protein